MQAPCVRQMARKSMASESRSVIEKPERPLMRGDPVRQALRPGRLGVGVVRRAQHRDEHLRRARLARVPVDDADRLTGVIDEGRLAGPVGLAHHHIDLAGKGPVMLVEPTVAEALRLRQCAAISESSVYAPRGRSVLNSVNLCDTISAG